MAKTVTTPKKKEWIRETTVKEGKKNMSWRQLGSPTQEQKKESKRQADIRRGH